MDYFVSRSPADRKRRAELAIGATLRQIKHGRLAFDDWARECLAHAIGAGWRGLYDLARVDGRLARAPVEQRSKRARRPCAPSMTVSQLDRAFAKVKAWPPLEHPTFG
jgi:hypothetical protein